MGRPRRSDQTTAMLRREIMGGRFRGVSVLPGERQLAISLQVSRTTLRRAMAELVQEGLLRQRQGMGTYVNDGVEVPIKMPVIVPLVYAGLTGRADGVTELSRGRFRASMDEVMTFGLASGDEVYRTARLLLSDGHPHAVERASAPWRLFKGEPALGEFLPEAVSSPGNRPAKRLQRLRLGVLSEADAAHLGTPPTTAAVHVYEAFFTATGGCCAINQAVYQATQFDAVFATSFSASGPSLLSA